MLLNPGQDFSLFGVYGTESDEIKIFNMLNLTLKIISILPVTQAPPGLAGLTGLDDYSKLHNLLPSIRPSPSCMSQKLLLRGSLTPICYSLVTSHVTSETAAVCSSVQGFLARDLVPLLTSAQLQESS